MDASRDGTIVVGVNASDSAREAAEWAADLASGQGEPLHLVHVVPGSYQDAPIAVLPVWLAELRATARRLGVRDCVAEVRPGEPVGVLTACADGAAMLVLGSYGDGAWSGMLAGSVALALLERVRCPVAVVRGASPRVPPPRGGPVVVGVDGSPAGRAALDVAAGLAGAMGARLMAVRVWSDVVAASDGAAHRRTEDWPVLEAEARDLLEAELARVTATHPGIEVQRDVDEDSPLRALLDRAGTARMIVVGHRRLPASAPGAAGMLLGSTSRGLVEFAECPVVVVGPAMAAAPPADLLSGT
ncbi:universal stress protein [Pseudonocardia broussonetiae]|uniref:Universal stress protein n=1 Tax=Pseudonocardia broussonetiae TaxID=2736640 RepID=A0A6M6JLJ0_9PSEU|nr:universal stress protein [Pseudonocardia broussonetiae]QJY48994.1 universal stress protein [Pseudonocardia broussonetiae]